MSDKVTYEQQQEMGLIRHQRGAFVAPPEKLQAPIPTPVIRMDADLNLNLPTNSTQQVVMRTSGTDRAKGFAIETRELGIVFGAGMVIVGYFVGDWPFFSMWTLSLFCITYAVTWAWAYYQHKHTSAEGVSLYEAKVKGEVIKQVVAAQVRQYEKNSEQERQHRQDYHERRLGK